MWTPIACKQLLYLGDIVKSGRARGTREETRGRGTVERKWPRAASPLACSFSRGSLRSQARTPMAINAENGHFFLVNLTESNPWKQGPTLQQKDRILIKDLK